MVWTFRFFTEHRPQKILVDPMLGSIASPVSFIGSRRYSEDILHMVDDMPPIDAVLITHDHYDHLDYPSILKLKEKAGHFLRSPRSQRTLDTVGS